MHSACRSSTSFHFSRYILAILAINSAGLSLKVYEQVCVRRGRWHYFFHTAVSTLLPRAACNMKIQQPVCLAPMLSSALAQTGYGSPESTCASIAENFQYDNTVVNFAEYLSAGTNITLDQSGALATCGRPAQTIPADLCRIAMLVHTSDRSNITLEAWLPTNWTGRFLSVGNGGLSGCIQYEDIAYGTELGFASVGANNGHNGTSGEPFYQNADVVEDFAYRSVHTGVVVGKAVTEAYYESEYSKSYYLGCSTGGRQGFKEVQDFPEDFDGVVVGAPALAFNNLSSWSGIFYLRTGPVNSSTWLTPDEWALVHEDVLKHCDGLDGAEDGIIESVNLCHYRPVTLQCPSDVTDTSGCLSAEKVETYRKVYEDYWGWGADNQSALIYPRMNPGNELSARFTYYNGNPFPYTEDWYRYAILNDPTWTADQLNNYYAALAATINPFNIETWEGDLSAFRDKGGKVLHYHGNADSIITSENSPRYYGHVSATMSAPPQELDDFYRYFPVGGMDHCAGGVGAWVLGQSSLTAPGRARDSQHNVLLRVVDWVENGNAPETITGTKFVNVSELVNFLRADDWY